MTTSERVPVYFLPEDLGDAYALAAARETARTSTPRPDVAEEYVVPGWTREQIERAYRESPEGMRLIFDGMIDRPDEVLDASDLASFLTHKPGATNVVVRGTMGAFANRCVSRYGRQREDFPFHHWYVDGGYARYQMPTIVADVMREIRDGSP